METLLILLFVIAIFLGIAMLAYMIGVAKFKKEQEEKARKKLEDSDSES